MKWLIKLDELLNTEFDKSDWADAFKSGTDLGKFKSNIEEKERSINIKAFEYLNLSVLEGEYIQNEEDFKDKIKLLFSKVGNLQKPLITEEDNDYRFTDLFNKIEFLYTLKKAIEVYKRITDNILKQIRNLHKNIVIDVSDTYDGTGKYFLKKDDILEESLFDLFNQSLYLFRTAFFLENNNNEFRYLIETKDSLEKLKGKIEIPDTFFTQIIDTLIELSIFLQRKIIIRICQNEDRSKDSYVFNFEEFNFSLDEHKLKEEYFTTWDNYSQNHYYSDESKERENLLKKNAEQNLNVFKTPLQTFYLVHSFIKYYKDIHPNLKKLENLKLFFDDFKPTSEFDEFALNISRNYLFNNVLSLKMSNILIDDLDQIVNECKEFQTTSSINNFFPFYKISRYLEDFIKIHLKNEKLDESILEKIETALIKLKKTVALYNKNFQWSEQHLFFAYQLPFEESKVKIALNSDLQINLFVPCSFLLKIDYSKYDEFSSEIKYFILNSEVEIKSIKSIISWNKKIKDKELEFEKELKDQSKKNIELLGIFSAIIALLFQGAYTVNSNVSYQDKLFTLITMFIVLISFLLMLRSFYSKRFEKNELITIRIVAFLIIPILLLTTIILFKILK